MVVEVLLVLDLLTNSFLNISESGVYVLLVFKNCSKKANGKFPSD